MIREVFTSVSHPVGDTFTAPAEPENATHPYQMIGSHQSHDGAEVITIWRTALKPDPEPTPAA